MEQVPGTATRTVGIDLASQPAETGVCIIDWGHAPARVVSLADQRFTDEVLLGLMLDPSVARVGIDAPFGWPLAFVDAVATYRDGGGWLALEHDELRFRATEVHVARETGQAALSVATSNLAWPAMRCARLLSQAGDTGLDRSGHGRFVEVYPAAALRRWGIIALELSVSQAAYKGSKLGRRERREVLVESLAVALDGVVVLSDAVKDACAADDDDLDALVCALIARAVGLGLTDPIPAGQRWRALREGWIQLPRADSLRLLAGQVAKAAATS